VFTSEIKVYAYYEQHNQNDRYELEKHNNLQIVFNQLIPVYAGGIESAKSKKKRKYSRGYLLMRLYCAVFVFWM
jgi:hypothetical protein